MEQWNKIEHRLFAHITQNWRGRPLVSHEAIVNLIANTTTAGLRVRAKIDTRNYETKKKVPKHVIGNLALRRHEFTTLSIRKLRDSVLFAQ